MGDPSLELTTGWIWPDHCGCAQPINYVPREGDILLMSSRNALYTFLYGLGGVGHPLHMGMIVKTSCGELAILESGGSQDKRVSLLPVHERLIEYLGSAKDVVIWVRPIMGPLHDYQSAQLTCFAESQVGKEFSTIRSALFVLPGEPQVKTSPEQEKWFCSEIVVEALKQADLVRGLPRPAAINPEDCYHNRDIDLDFYWLPALRWSRCPTFPTRLPPMAPKRPE
jgi:hypothetical protein